MESAELVPCTRHPLDRRRFITLLSGGLLAPLVAEAQQTGKVTPFLSLQTTERPSLPTQPFRSLGISSARTGTRLPSELKAASGS